MKKIIKLFFLVGVFFVFPCAMHAKISLPAFISEGMVLQQLTSTSLWGKALPGKTITVRASWDNMNYSTKADSEGRWRIQLKTPQAGGPYFIAFSEGNDSFTLHDVWIGEVWLCSGQSNMEMPMKGFKNQPVEGSNMDILKSTNSQLRLFTVKRHSTLAAQEDIEGEWQTANPVSVSEFSATAYYFGRLLQEILKVPVGLICSSWGGSPIESWMDRGMLQPFPGIKLPQTEEDIKEKNRTPTTLFNGMIAPLVGFAIKGVIWYQGESNYDRYTSYADLLLAMVNGWRTKWNRGVFPFYYCQIAPYDYRLITPHGEEVINSAYLREAQLKAESRIENSGMAVLLDAGLEKGIHPPKKQIAGERLALLAFAKTYRINGIVADSPVYKDMTIKGDTAILSFDRAEMWLTAPKGDLKNFKMAGLDKKFYPADAWINRSKVYVRSEAVKHPVAVRYAFENYVEGDLYGTEGLPVSSFRTDDW